MPKQARAARQGGSRGECRAARAGSEAPPFCSSEQRRAEKRTLQFSIFARAGFFILKGKVRFSVRQCRLAARRRGGAIGFFQDFLIK
ncbi:MAG: hypothetical protein A3G49_03945 [Candidatus Sungbacteria bacterium RIFCSPLOWO2_12_FULL_41_11]|uniref:Uncharacterized protein n=1 Tax=Candidatus Sungbacteria bacterium RIFCSPLOWO2_12_FULL_41_11 TaxID=1802286 RepID=A0A1G2LMI0_9BACT|nr:MAG: hypothetical protein A3G49_03945 [Candidatus Sungbacteria bacterium RIFCSPLOWO2_12_FULL_41_11]